MRIRSKIAMFAICITAAGQAEAGWPHWKLWKAPADCCTSADQECVELEDCVDSSGSGCCDLKKRPALFRGKLLSYSTDWVKKVCHRDSCTDCLSEGCVDACLSDVGGRYEEALSFPEPEEKGQEERGPELNRETQLPQETTKSVYSSPFPRFSTTEDAPAPRPADSLRPRQEKTAEQDTFLMPLPIR